MAMLIKWPLKPEDSGEAQAQKKALEEHEKQKEKERKDLELALEIRETFTEMIEEIKQGKVKPNTHINNEKMNFTGEQIAEMQGSKALGELLTKKQELTKARKYAEGEARGKRILERVIGKEIRDDLDYKREFENLNRQQTEEYLARMMRPEEEPREEVKEEIKEEPKKELEELKEEAEEEPEEKPQEDVIEYEL